MAAPLAVALSVLLAPLAAREESAGPEGDSAPRAAPPSLAWDRLADLPSGAEVAGPFAGIASGWLLVAGGANFPDGPPWSGHAKKWRSAIWALPTPEATWRRVGELPRPLAYGASLPIGDGVLVVGGGDDRRHTREVGVLTRDGGSVRYEPLAPLPGPLAFHSAARVGDTVFVAGGLESPHAPVASSAFWALDLEGEAPAGAWRELEPWPGPPRFLAVAGSRDGAFWLFSGAERIPGADGKPARRYLRDAYRYRPGEGWKRIADLPRPAVAAPSPALDVGPHHLLIVGGDDGTHATEDLRDRHPGFPNESLRYHTITDTWTSEPGPILAAGDAGRVREGPPVTVPALRWKEAGSAWVIPSGEARPGVRTLRVLRARPRRVERELHPLDWIALLAYAAVLVALGLKLSGRERDTRDFFLAGGRIPWWAAGLSIFGTQLSAITFLSIPAKTYATDWTYLPLNLAIPLTAPIVVRIFLPALRRLDLVSIYEYLEHRFHLSVRLLASALFILMQLGRTGVVLFLPALALSASAGLDIRLSILTMGAIATVYTVLGGIEAVIWTDVIQVILLLGAAVLSLGVVAFDAGGFTAVLHAAEEAGKLRLARPGIDPALPTAWVVAVGGIFMALVPYTSDQSVAQRYLAVRSERDAARSVWTNAILTIPASLLFFALGSALFVFFRGRPDLLDPSLADDAIYPLFVCERLPPGVVGLVIAGVFAAAMSSLDSSMNSVATAFTCDFARRLRPERSEAHWLRFARAVTVAVGVLGTITALVLASWDVRSLWDVFLGLVGLFGGGLSGIFLLGITSRRANAAGALAGAISSGAVLLALRALTGLHFFLWPAIGIATCWLVGVVVSPFFGASQRCRKA